MKAITKMTAVMVALSMLQCDFAFPVRSFATDKLPDQPLNMMQSASNEGPIEHAYDPMAELEAREREQAYRESVKTVKNKILFSVSDYRSAEETPVYLTESSPMCSYHHLTDVSCLYESLNPQYGEECYEVFYEAATEAEDIWELVDQLLADDSVVHAEPVIKWGKTAVNEPLEVSKEEYEMQPHFSILETEKVWSSLKSSSSPGKGTVVAVIDTGVDYNHADLADNV